MTAQSHPSGVTGANGPDAVRVIIGGLPALPSIIRYLDEYEDKTRSIRTTEDEWRLLSDTVSVVIDHTYNDAHLRIFSKHFFAYQLSKLSCVSVGRIHLGFRNLFANSDDLITALCLHPVDLTSYWNRRILAAGGVEADAMAMKWLFHFMCDLALGAFRKSHHSLVASLPFNWHGNYKGIANGEDILTFAQERAIVHHLDLVTKAVSDNPNRILDETLTKACLLCISYQHGLRPVQICRVGVADLRFYEENDGEQIAHLVAYRAKKRSASAKTPFVCKIKSDWVPLLVEYHHRRGLGPVWQQYADADGKLFTMSKAAIIMAIGDVVEELTGERRTATILRHTAAQRMADSGASVEEVAEFLGHSDFDTCLVYFEASPAQAEIVNKAMAASPIYSRIAEVIATGTIDKAALLNLPSDQQVGGVPHGLPIAGIGACTLGQSLCAKNPVMSCYTCRKFIPVSDLDIHKQVLADLRVVVQFFFDEARGGLQSQAYKQLTSTLEAIQSVIKDVECLGEAAHD